MRRIASVIVFAGLFASTAIAQTPTHIEVEVLFGDVRTSPVFMKPTGVIGDPVVLANADPVHRPIFGIGVDVHLNSKIAATVRLASTGYKTHDIPNLPAPPGFGVNCNCGRVAHVSLSDRDDRVLLGAIVGLFERQAVRISLGAGLQIDSVVATERDRLTASFRPSLDNYVDKPLRHKRHYPVLIGNGKFDFATHAFLFGEMAVRVSPDSSELIYPTARLFPAAGIGVRF